MECKKRATRVFNMSVFEYVRDCVRIARLQFEFEALATELTQNHVRVLFVHRPVARSLFLRVRNGSCAITETRRQ